MSNIVELAIAQPSEMTVSDAQKTLDIVRAFRITNPDQSVELQQTRQNINTRIKALDDERLGMTRPIDAAKAKIMKFFERPTEALKQARDACDAQIIAWTRKVEEERREAQRQAELAAQRERERLQAIADEARRKAEAEQRERDRVAREAREVAEAEQRRLQVIADDARRAGNAEAARKAAEEAARKRLQDEADEAERKRRDEAARISADAKAEKYEERAATHVAPVVVADIGAAKGVGVRENWTFEITDRTKINAAFLMPDEIKIGKQVKAMKGDAAALIGEGVRVFNSPIVASRKAS